MSSELLHLLRLGSDNLASWDRVIVTNNVAAIPPVNETPGDFVWNRGFNVVLLDRWGRPAFFAKCRSAGDVKLRHEAASMKALRDVSELRPFIPAVRELQSDRLHVMMTPFLRGAPLNGLLEGRFNRRAANTVRRALVGITKLSHHSTHALPQLVSEGPVELERELESVLSYLVNVGLSSEEAEALQRVADGAPVVPRRLQHGDLWPANVIQSGRDIWFIDFEMFGNVQVPMYDVFHFLRTSSEAWGTAEGEAWLDRMLMAGPVGAFTRSCAGTAARELGIELHQATTALVYYVTHFSATTHKRNPEGIVWKVFFREVQAMAAAIGRGIDLTQLFLHPA